METKMIKEEVPDKDFPDTDRISSLRSRNKGSGIVTSLTTNNGKTQQQTDRLTNCKTPDSPEGARLSSSNSSTSSLGGGNNVTTTQQQQSQTQQSTILSSQQLNSSLSPNHQSQSTPNNTSLVNRHHSPPRITTQLGVVVTTNGAGALSPSSMQTHMQITSGGPTLHHRASTSPDTVNNLVVTTTPPLSLTVDHNTSAVTSQQNSGGGVSGGGISTLSTTNHNSNSYLNYNPLRQLNKVKRFLCTLVQFGADIGPDIGDRVRSMVLSLVSSNLSIEEFHQALQDVTNFPLRPFVLPFLRAHLPLLQREVHNLARASKQSTLQYVRTHDHIVLDPTFSPSEASEIFFSNEQQPQQSSIIAPKRRASDSFYENGIPSNGTNSLITSTIPTQQSNESNHDYSIPSKRQITSQYYQQNPFLLSTAVGTIPAPNISTHSSTFFLPTNATTTLPTVGSSSAGTLQAQIVDPYANTNHVQSAAAITPIISNKIENDSNENNSYRHFSTNLLCGNNNNNNNNGSNRGDEEWKNIHVMLNCILSMVEKTKRALTILQQRNGQDQTNDWLRKQDIGIDFKKAANEIMIQAIRQTEDRVAEVKRKAEEAVSEVKKQAVIELQKAVQLAETKACELVANERAKMEKILLDVRKKSTDDVLLNQQHDVHDNSQSPPIIAQPATSSQNSCWNCGRKANETCSGCNVARYCGAFCQHKDWENHHAVCCQQNTLSASKLASILNPNNNSNKLSNLQSNSSNPATQITKSSRNDTTCTTNRSSTPVSSTNSRNGNRDTDRNSSIISK